MRKVRVMFAFGLALILLFGACDTAQTGTQPTNAPETTEAPAVTEVPEVTAPVVGTEEITETPAPTEGVTEVTEVPQPTEAPVVTEEAAATEAPTVTEAPKATEVPKATATPKPTATPRPTATPKLTKEPDADGELTFTFGEMKCVTSFNGSYTLQADGSVKAQFNEQWAQAFYAFPQGVDLSDCEYITVKAKSGKYPLGVKLFHEGIFTDVWSSEIYCKGDCIGEGVAIYELSPEMMLGALD